MKKRRAGKGKYKRNAEETFEAERENTDRYKGGGGGGGRKEAPGDLHAKI